MCLEEGNLSIPRTLEYFCEGGHNPRGGCNGVLLRTLGKVRDHGVVDSATSQSLQKVKCFIWDDQLEGEEIQLSWELAGCTSSPELDST